MSSSIMKNSKNAINASINRINEHEKLYSREKNRPKHPNRKKIEKKEWKKEKKTNRIIKRIQEKRDKWQKQVRK